MTARISFLSDGTPVASNPLLPGWFCRGCQAFNGEAKERLVRCRCCDKPSHLLPTWKQHLATLTWFEWRGRTYERTEPYPEVQDNV